MVYFVVLSVDAGAFFVDPEILHYCTVILHRPRIIVGDALFEPAGPFPQKSGAQPISHNISVKCRLTVSLNNALCTCTHVCTKNVDLLYYFCIL